MNSSALQCYESNKAECTEASNDFVPTRLPVLLAIVALVSIDPWSCAKRQAPKPWSRGLPWRTQRSVSPYCLVLSPLLMLPWPGQYWERQNSTMSFGTASYARDEGICAASPQKPGKTRDSNPIARALAWWKRSARCRWRAPDQESLTV